MVSTRATNDSPPATPRSASSRRKSGKASASATASASPTRARSKSRGRQPANASASNSVAKRAASRSTAPTPRAARSSNTFSHTPSPITLLWLGISLPLVVWDTGYVLGRPHTMEGGWAHWPMYSPYKLYGEVDHIYGWPALHANNGFTAAQGFLNVLETLMYAAYLWLWYSRGTAPRGQPVTAKAVAGKYGALAVLIAFSAAVMTLSKTVLYCKLMGANAKGGKYGKLC